VALTAQRIMGTIGASQALTLIGPEFFSLADGDFGNLGMKGADQDPLNRIECSMQYSESGPFFAPLTYFLRLLSRESLHQKVLKKSMDTTEEFHRTKDVHLSEYFTLS
jgi:hypothetical protein